MVLADRAHWAPQACGQGCYVHYCAVLPCPPSVPCRCLWGWWKVWSAGICSSFTSSARTPKWSGIPCCRCHCSCHNLLWHLPLHCHWNEVVYRQAHSVFHKNWCFFPFSGKTELTVCVPAGCMYSLSMICICRCHFSTFKQCQEWLKRLNRAIARPAKPEDLFAFAYHAWCLGVCVDEEDQHAHLCRPGKILACLIPVYPSRGTVMQLEPSFITWCLAASYAVLYP